MSWPQIAVLRERFPTLGHWEPRGSWELWRAREDQPGGGWYWRYVLVLGDEAIGTIQVSPEAATMVSDAYVRYEIVVAALVDEGVPVKLARAKVLHLERRGLLDSGVSSDYAWPRFVTPACYARARRAVSAG